MNKYEKSAAVSAIWAANILGNGVNGQATTTGKMFVNKMLFCEHRYLQNEFFKEVVLRFIATAANLKDNQYDPRNAGMVKTCKYIVGKLMTAWDEERKSVYEPRPIDDEKLREEINAMFMYKDMTSDLPYKYDCEDEG